MLEKSLHFPIKPGVVAAWNAHTVVIVSPTVGSTARVRDVATGEERDVAVDELHDSSGVGLKRRHHGACNTPHYARSGRSDCGWD
jgi:hypothetical protein